MGMQQQKPATTVRWHKANVSSAISHNNVIVSVVRTVNFVLEESNSHRKYMRALTARGMLHIYLLKSSARKIQLST